MSIRRAQDERIKGTPDVKKHVLNEELLNWQEVSE
jgi:hypothetical protein